MKEKPQPIHYAPNLNWNIAACSPFRSPDQLFFATTNWDEVKCEKCLEALEIAKKFVMEHKEMRDWQSFFSAEDFKEYTRVLYPDLGCPEYFADRANAILREELEKCSTLYESYISGQWLETNLEVAQKEFGRGLKLTARLVDVRVIENGKFQQITRRNEGGFCST